MIKQPSLVQRPTLALRSAFSLIELIIGVAIISIIAIMLSFSWIDASRNFNVINILQGNNSSFLESFKVVDDNVRSAIAFPISYTHPVTGVVYTIDDGKTLIMRQYGLANLKGQVNCNISDYIIYTMDANNNLLEIVVADPQSARSSRNVIRFKTAKSLSFVQKKEGVTINPHRQVTMSMTADQYNTTSPVLSYSQEMIARND